MRKEGHFRDASLQWREMQFWLEQCTNYSQQAAIILGFAFASFSADNLGVLPWSDMPLTSGTFVVASTVGMVSALSVVAFASHLMLASERLAMTTAVKVAAVAVRSRMSLVVVCYIISLLSLIVAAMSLLFTMCDYKDENHGGDRAEDVCNRAASVSAAVVAIAIAGNFIAVRNTRRMVRQAKGRDGKRHKSFHLSRIATQAHPCPAPSPAVCDHSFARLVDPPRHLTTSPPLTTSLTDSQTRDPSPDTRNGSLTSRRTAAPPQLREHHEIIGVTRNSTGHSDAAGSSFEDAAEVSPFRPGAARTLPQREVAVSHDSYYTRF